MNTTPAVEPEKKNVLLDPKANLKSLARAVIVLGLLGVAVWLFISLKYGNRAANTAAAIVTRQPIELRNSVENLRANSTAWLSVSTPYAGTLSVELTVVNGNGLNVWLVPAAELENVKAGKSFRFVTGFEAEKTKAYRRVLRVRSGSYYLVLRDPTLGVLSATSSDVKIHVRFEP